VLGTPPYMSPEQFTGKALDARSDIYSLAVMSYEMLTGKLPFEADTPWQWATQHMTAQPIPFEVSAPAKHLPEGMRKAILRGLSKEREQRPATAREFFTELSDGGRMTVEANPAETAAAARTGTAAMDAVPAFASNPAQAAPYAPAAHPAPTPMAHAAAAAVPAAPARGGAGGGGGKGLIFGLVGVGAVLLGAILILVLKSNKPTNDDLPPIAINTSPPAAATQGPVEIKPLDTPPADVPVQTGGSSATASGGGAATPAETGKPANTGKPTGTGTGTPAPAKDPCDACMAAASGGNATAVSGALSRCTDAGKQAQCKAMLGRTGSGAVKQAALNGQCDRAKALVAAADAIGVKGTARGLTGSSCK
jgi:eukaryotic-like serine/threonine-protein kinase